MPAIIAPRPPNLSGYALKSEVPAFINGGAFQTIENLLANFPASATYLGMYARISNVFGSVRTVMICEYDGNSYYWRPQRTDYAIDSTQASGTMSLLPLFTAPEIRLQSTLVGLMTITPSTVNVWPGCSYLIYAPTSLGIYSLTLTGLVGGLTAALLGGSSRRIVYTAAGWRA